MDTQQLTAILRQISEVDLERLTPDEMLAFLARCIQHEMGVRRVVLRGALKEPGEPRVRPDATVINGASDDAYPALADKVGELKLLGEPVVLDDTAEATHRFVPGPFESPDVTLGVDECCLLMRVPRPNSLTWVLVFLDRAQATDHVLSEWTGAIPALLGGVFRCVDPGAQDTVRGARTRFYRALLNIAPASPTDYFKQICRAWQEVSGADWAWLWLYNPKYDEFEIVQFASKDREVDAKGSDLPTSRTAPGKEAMANYCRFTGQAVFTDDIGGWHQTYDGHSYRIVTAHELIRLGAKAFECVPLFTATSQENADEEPMRGAISLQFRDPSTRVRHSNEALINMGRCTAVCIRNSLAWKQRRVLVTLNEMAHRYLTQPSRQPEQVRKRYLKELIKLVKVELQVNGVSIFYRMGDEETIQCLASTGLQGREGKRIKERDFTEVIYQKGEGLTGRCFAETELIMGANVNEMPGHLGKFAEIGKDSLKGELDPIILCPIKPAHNPESGDTSPALGVIRCVENWSPILPGRRCHFDPADVETLQFVSQQIGPVLQTFAQRVERELRIGVVRHDLYAPLTMMRDTVEKMIRDRSHGLPFGQHDLKDLQVSASVALNLAKQLDPDAGAEQDDADDAEPGASLTFTKLDGDIVARLKDMLKHYAQETNRMRIHFDGFEDWPRLFVDRHLVERTIYNLVVNAIKYGEPGTVIELEALKPDTDDEYYIVQIANEGIGVTRDEEHHIFRAGYRSSRARHRAAAGVGLGLSIAKRVMKLHNGDIRLTQRKNPTVFSLLFPKELEGSKA